MAKKTVKRKKKPSVKRKVKKAPKRKKATAKKKMVKKKPPAKKSVKTVKKKAIPELPQEPLGRVTHYFSKAKAAAVKIEREGIRVGDQLFFKGHTTQFKQEVHSLQIDRQVVTQASEGDEVGIQVKSKVREHDLVFKLPERS